MSAELEQVTLAVAAINKVEAGLAVLRERFGGVVYEVTTIEGLEAAKAARSEIREPRYEVEKIRKAAKAPLLALGKKLDSEAARITTELEKIETPIHQQIKAEEDRKEAEREAKVLAEIARVAGINKLLDGIRGWPIQATGKPSARVAELLAHAESYDLAESVFQERLDDAKAVLEVSRAALRGLHVAALDAEAKEVQLALDRQEFARLKAEEAERQRLAREAQAKADADAKTERDRLEAIAKAERDAEAKIQADARAAQDAIDKANRQRNEAALQEIQAIHHQLIIADTGRIPYCKGGDLESIDWVIQETDKWEITEEKFGALFAMAVKMKEGTLIALMAKRVGFVNRQENAAETQRLADERADVARQQEALRVSKLPPARKPKHSPGAEAIADAVASYFGVDGAVARRWLREIDWEQVAA